MIIPRLTNPDVPEAISSIVYRMHFKLFRLDIVKTSDEVLIRETPRVGHNAIFYSAALECEGLKFEVLYRSHPLLEPSALNIFINIITH